MSGITWKDHLRYRFDNFMSRGTGALIGGLAVFSLAVIFTAALVIMIMDVRPAGADEPFSFIEASWEALMRTLDAGTMGGDAGWAFRLVMFAVTLGGVFIISTLIGLLTSGIERRLEEMRKGRSRVIENNHTVILGWNKQIFSVIAELIIANESQKDACIVILAGQDKVEMEDALHDRLPHPHNTRLVCRSGEPTNLHDLELTNLSTSKSIIILSPESDFPDAEVIKTLLAIIHQPGRRAEPYHIVAELRDPKNLTPAQLVGKDEVEVVLVSDLIARIIAQTCLQSGLSTIYSELLDFEGDEIYFTREPRLEGKTFAEALPAYEDSTVIGIQSSDGLPRLNPPMETCIQPGDQLIVITEDDSTIHFTGAPAKVSYIEHVRLTPARRASAERILILGWNQEARTLLRELAGYLPPDSEITIAARTAHLDLEVERCCGGNPHLHYHVVNVDPSDRQDLEGLDPGRFHHIVVLAYSDAASAQQADSVTLVTLLHLRDLAERHGYTYAIVSHILDVHNRDLAEIGRADDFVVSDKLASMMLAQVAENKDLNQLFKFLFDPAGSEVYLKPAADYINPGQTINFYTLIEAARQKGETAIGYRLQAQARQADKDYGVIINPTKSHPFALDAKDRIIVLADN